MTNETSVDDPRETARLLEPAWFLIVKASLRREKLGLWVAYGVQSFWWHATKVVGGLHRVGRRTEQSIAALEARVWLEANAYRRTLCSACREESGAHTCDLGDTVAQEAS